jgi:hypothetical protein
MAGREQNAKVMVMVKIKKQHFNLKKYLEHRSVIGGPDKIGPWAAGWTTQF